MNRTISIELFEEHDNVNFYTLRFDKEETEIDKFFNKFPEGCKYDNDIDTIIKWIDNIGIRSAHERYFRIEGKMKDNVYAIPIDTCNLRLYVIRLNQDIVILGNGDLKTTSTYNNDPVLNAIVELLQEINKYINYRLGDKIQIYNKQFYGNLKFIIKKRSNEK